MAAKPRGKPFPKGVTGNPAGSSNRKRTLAKISRLTNEQIEQVGAVILGGNRADLRALAEHQDASILQVWIAGLIASSMKKGDSQTFRVIMDRLVGRAKETLVHSGPDGGPIAHEKVTMTYEQKLERLAKLRAQRELAGR